MNFGFRNNKEKQQPHILSESDIRNRLYGSAVSITDPKDEAYKKHAKYEKPKSGAASEDNSRIKEDIASLTKELEQTKKKLKRIKGLKARKIRFVIISLIVIIALAGVSTFAIRRLISTGKPFLDKAAQEKQVIAVRYAVQTATYTSLADAEKLRNSLYAKGYNAFVHKVSGKKAKYIVYIGGFKEKKDAINCLNKIKSQERLKSSFVTGMPQ